MNWYGDALVWALNELPCIAMTFREVPPLGLPRRALVRILSPPAMVSSHKQYKPMGTPPRSLWLIFIGEVAV